MRTRALPLALVAAGLLATGLLSCAGDPELLVPADDPGPQYGLGGKADGFQAPAADQLAPAWLLSARAAGTWEDEPQTGNGKKYGLIRGWVDARVKNRRYQKRVFVEVAAPYEGGALMRTIHTTWHKGSLGDGYEAFGTDTVEIYPDGGPHDASLAGPVLYRLRMQEDPDGDGKDQMVVTGWYRLYGDGEPVPIESDPWLPGLESPALAAGMASAPEVFHSPWDGSGAVVAEQIAQIAAAKQAAPHEQHTVHAAIFNINDPQIVDQLIRAHEAGVQVRLVTQASKLAPAAYWQTEDDRLLQAGVPLLGLRRPGRGAMHSKIAIFDGRKVATGSFNWEVGSSTENHENMLLTDHPELVAAYAERFEVIAGMVQRPRKHATDPSAEVSVSFAPDEEPYRIVGQLIDKAKKTIHVAMFTAKDIEYEEGGGKTSLFVKLGNAVNRGLDVRLVTDFGIAEADEYYGVMSEDDPQDEWLEDMGVHVVRADNKMGAYSSMHHKFMVVDGAVAVTGAMNWYYDAAFLNDEDQLVWRSEALAAEYTGELTDILRRYDPAYDPSE